MFFILLLYMLCALTFTVGKATLFYTQPFFYVGIRMALSGLMLLFIYLAWHRKPIAVKYKDWVLLLQVAFFAIYCAYVCDLWSLQFITSIESSLIFNLSPFFAAFFSYLWFKEPITTKKLLGLAIGASSIIPLLFVHTINLQQHIIPLTVLLFGVASSAYGWIVMRDLVKIKNYNPIMINGIAMFLGGSSALVASFWFESEQVPLVTNWSYFIKLLVVMIVLANMLFTNLYAYLLKYYTATLLSFAGFTCPLFVSIFSYYFLDEALNWEFFFSFITISTGLYVFYQEEIKTEYIKASSKNKTALF